MIRYVLAIDGGGIRGILPATVLQAVENAMGKPSAQVFDLICGNSTGGIIACGLVAGVPAQALVALYVNHGAEIFSRGLGKIIWSVNGITGPKYDPAPLEAQLRTTLHGKMLADVGGCELLVPAYCIQYPVPGDYDGDGVVEGRGSYFFRSWLARQSHQDDFPLWQVARSTSAAPTYFPPFRAISGAQAAWWMTDGGTFANNPALCAYAAARNIWPDDDIEVVSIGTGTQVTALDGSRAAGWGLVGWATETVDLFMDGQADAVTFQAVTILGKRFLRADIALGAVPGVESAFDNASATNIAALGNLANAMTAQFAAPIVAKLKAAKG